MSIDDNARSGLKAAALWTLLEFVIRDGLIVGAAAGLVLLSGKVPRDSHVSPLLVGMIAAVPLALSAVSLTIIFRRRAAKERLSLSDLGYQFDRRNVYAGLISGLLLIFVGWATSHVDLVLFPGGALGFERLIRLMVQSGPIVIIGMLAANGFLAPIAEEYVWRGYIQHRLALAWGVRTGLLVTALLFSAKHMVVDLSVGRTTTLLVLACLVGLIRWRWGTAASTVAHCTLNFFGTLLVFGAAAGVIPV